ncbi:MAG: hypothetical protein Q9181_006692 [Wetmoreana brouardii]
MEIAGVAVGVIGLAGLFNACKDAIEHFNSYKNADSDFRYIETRFLTDKALFERWANGVGYAENQLDETKFASRLNGQDAVALTVRTILSSIPEILRSAEKASSAVRSQLPSIEPTNTTHSYDLSQRRPIIPDRKSLSVSMRSRLAWTISKKTKFNDQVEAFGVLVGKLYTLIPVLGLSPNEKLDPGFAQLAERLETLLNVSEQRALLFEQTQGGLHKMIEWVEARARKETCDWLGAIDTEQQYEAALSTCLSDTCQWIFQDPQYLEWAFPAGKAKLFWLHGPAGYGKTVLCAKCVQSMQAQSESPVAYFFCSSNFGAQREPSAILRSWIAQLVFQNYDALDVVRDRGRQKSTHQASESDLWELFQSIMSHLPDCIFFVDGFDECYRAGDRKSNVGQFLRTDFLAKLKTSLATTCSRVLLVSRDEVDIRSQLSSSNEHPSGLTMYERTISMEDVQSDVEIFSRSIVDNRLSNKDEILREEIAALMAERCQGMFLWIKLHQPELRKSKNRKQLRDTVGSIPLGLEHAYEQDWVNIQNLSSDDRSRALAILRWAMFATRPLTVGELTEALLIDPLRVGQNLPIDELPDKIDQDYIDDGILILCGSLLKVRHASSETPVKSWTVHLVHFSVVEFLLNAKLRIDSSTIDQWPFDDSTSQHTYLASICLRYMTYTNTWQRPASESEDCASPLFLDYALDSWRPHLTMGDELSPECWPLMQTLFDPRNPNWDKWRSRLEHLELAWHPNHNPEKDNIAAPLYYASLYGLVGTMEYLEREHIVVSNATGGCYGTALQAACVGGHLAAVVYLCAAGVDVNVQAGIHGNAANAAASYRHWDIFRYLVDAGARWSVCPIDGAMPIHYAASSGHFEIVHLLLKLGADVNVVQDSFGITPLHCAIWNGHHAVVKLLLESGADVSVASPDGETPLHWAAVEGFPEIIRILLERGADPEAKKSFNNQTPLHKAAQMGHTDAVRILLDLGADVEAKNSSGDLTPLNMAAWGGHADAVKILLDQGANIEAKEKLAGSTPLHEAARKGHTDAVRILLDQGANIEAEQSWDSLTPLHLAAFEGHTDAVRILLNQGANIEAEQSWDSLTPLHLAAFEGRTDAIRILLDRGADIEAVDQSRRTPLHLAASEGHADTIRILLDQGVNVEAVDQSRRTPLHLAASEGHADTIRILLDQGVNVEAVDQSRRTPLHLAAWKGHADTVKILLDRGADVEAVNQYRRSPLHLAALDGHAGAIRILLDRGADNEAVDLSRRTPLYTAACEGHADAVRILLDTGTNPAISDYTGDTSLHAAASNGHLKTVILLLEHLRDVTVLRDSDTDPTAALATWSNSKNFLMERTPLHLAAAGHHSDVIDYLLRRGADVNIRDGWGLTSLDYVCSDEDLLNLMTGQVPHDRTLPALSVRRDYIIASVIRLVDHIQFGTTTRGQGTGKYELGHCLVILNDERAACDVLYYDTANVVCDVCDKNCRPGDWNICHECVDVDLCQLCMGTYAAKPPSPGCTNHTFIDIPAKEPESTNTEAAKTADELQQQWIKTLEMLRSKYQSIQTLESQLDELGSSSETRV